ncbi:MAG: hypothetical protein IT533_11540 [Hyphomicrobiales bacterium]|nr:hypothetical protein [Hyphomicrobiales bacterium]
MRKRLAIALVLLLAVQARADEHKVWAAGPYSVSDELGGFTITSVTGTGLREDPIVVTQEFTSSSPVTLVIRAIKLGLTYDDPREFATGTLRIRLETLNNSGQAWTEFEFELQERKGQASIFSDGLSFDQRRDDGQNISSDSFASFSRNFEPYDRLRFTDGRIDPLKTGSFEFMITDFTPRPEFYLVQDPRIPLS